MHICLLFIICPYSNLFSSRQAMWAHCLQWIRPQQPSEKTQIKLSLLVQKQLMLIHCL